VHTRLTWICHGPTSANREGRFPLNEPLEQSAVVETAALTERLRHADRSASSPALAGLQTAEILSLAATGAETDRDGDDFPDRGETLDAAIGHLEQVRALREQQKLLAELRRKSQERRPGENQEQDNQAVDASAGQSANDAEIDLLKQLQEKARTPDLRRVM